MDKAIELDIFSKLDALWQRFDLLAEKRKTMSDMDFVVEQVNIKKSMEDCFEYLQHYDIKYISYKKSRFHTEEQTRQELLDLDKAIKKIIEGDLNKTR